MKDFIKYIDFFKVNTRIGRIRHAAQFSFWFAIIIWLLILMVRVAKTSISSNLWLVILILVLIFIALVNIVLLKIRRIHDMNYKAWWLLISLVPLLGIVVTLAIFGFEGTGANNRFGSPPLSPTIIDCLMILFTPITILFVNLFNLVG